MACTDRDADQADPDPGHPRDEGQRQMAEHDQHRRAGQRPFRAEQAVGDPCPEDRRQVHEPAVGADDGGGHGFGVAQPALAGGIVDVVRDQRLHAVEAETLPHLDAGKIRQTPGVSEELLLAVGERGLFVWRRRLVTLCQ